MAYFYIDLRDFSNYVNELSIEKEANYNAQVNAAGNTIVDLINYKRVINVGIIPLDDAVMKSLLEKLNMFNVNILIRNPETGQNEHINCIIPSSNIEYYTIQANKVSYKALKLKFIEL